MGEYLPGELHDRLRELRDAHGIKSQDKLADLVGVTRSTYGRVENGQTTDGTHIPIWIKGRGIQDNSRDGCIFPSVG